jgi:serine/threonine protein kinase
MLSHADDVNAYQNNVFIDEHWHARLADFGLAGWADATMATSTSNHAGSVRWMAPELHAVEPSPFCRTKRSDVYAFACISVEVSYGPPLRTYASHQRHFLFRFTPVNAHSMTFIVTSRSP